MNAYKDAEERCYNYFEGEYGTNGTYTEYFYDATTGTRTSRSVVKTFKYQGRWRLPTSAELKYIDFIQDQSGSAVKKLLEGTNYWTAETGKTYNFPNNTLDDRTSGNVRCVFDTYKVK